MTAAERRVRELVGAARRLADPSDPLGRRARTELVRTSALSAEGVEYALTHCLETAPSDAEVASLCASVPPAPRAQVILSANVFTAAHRAIALARAAAERVCVRPSRREPVFTALLAEALPGAFDVVSELAAEPGDHVYAYGSDETLAALRASLPTGVVFHGHGSGFGVAVIEAGRGDAEALARDVAAFDQRGCLSPRLALVRGSAAEVRDFAAALAGALAALERALPLGQLSPDERADVVRFRDAAAYAGELLRAGSGYVSVDATAERPPLLPPVGRNLHVTAAGDLRAQLEPLASRIAAVGVGGPTELEAELRRIAPRARFSPLGSMQRPAFDGPVDLRADPRGVVL